MRTQTLLALTVLSLLAACGGSVEQSSNGSTGGSAGNAGGSGGSVGGSGGAGGGAGGSTAGSSGTPGDPLQGSYDLSFSKITASSQLPSDKAISSDVPFRLDIVKNANSYAAAITPRWGAQFAMAVVVSSSELNLTGAATVSGVNNYASGFDTWDTLVLPRVASGKLSGGFSAKGREEVLSGDVGWMADLDGTGGLTPDALAPESKLLEAGPGSPPAGRLPWESLAVRFAEGVQTGDTTGAIALQDGNGLQPIAWQPSSTSPEVAWTGTIEVDGYLPQWSLAGWFPTLTQNAGLRDLVQHTGPGWSTSVPFSDVGPAVDAFMFDGDALPMMAEWAPGDIQYYGQKTGSDPHCESSGCVQIGPYLMNSCPSASMGIAGRLNTSMTTITIRYRVVAAVDPSQSSPPSDWMSPFWVDIAVPGKAPASVEAVTQAYTAYLGPDDQNELWWGTEWTSMNVEVPGGSTPADGLGFAIHAGRKTTSCGGEMMPTMKRSLLIESVQPIGMK